MNLHWNYYIALDNDMARVSRFIEFCPENLNVFSLELAHLLFAASSEVDVVAKSLCNVLNLKLPKQPNMNNYRDALVPVLPDLCSEIVKVSRFGLTFTPWEDWANGTNPCWWQSYNKVKHKRDKFFNKATLENALNALAGLLVISLYYFKESRKLTDPNVTFKDITNTFGINETLMSCKNDYYCVFIIS